MISKRHRRLASQCFRESAPFPPTGVPDLRSDMISKRLQRGSRLILGFRAWRVVRDDELGISAVAPAVCQITLQACHQARHAIARHDADDGDRSRKLLPSRRATLLIPLYQDDEECWNLCDERATRL